MKCHQYSEAPRWEAAPLISFRSITIILYSWILAVAVTLPTRSLQHQDAVHELFKHTSVSTPSSSITTISLSAIEELQNQSQFDKAGLNSFKTKHVKNVYLWHKNLKEFRSSASNNNRYVVLQTWRREKLLRNEAVINPVFLVLVIKAGKLTSHSCTIHYPAKVGNQRHNCPKLAICLQSCAHLISETMMKIDRSAYFQGRLSLMLQSQNIIINYNMTPVSNKVSIHPNSIKTLTVCKVDVIPKKCKIERMLFLLWNNMSLQILQEQGRRKYWISIAHLQRHGYSIHYKRHYFRMKIFHEANTFFPTFDLHNSWFWFPTRSVAKSFYWYSVVDNDSGQKVTRNQPGSSMKAQWLLLRRYYWQSLIRHMCVEVAWCIIDNRDPSCEQLVYTHLFLRRCGYINLLSFTREKDARKIREHRDRITNRANTNSNKTPVSSAASFSHKHECSTTCSTSKHELTTNRLSRAAISLPLSADDSPVELNISAPKQTLNSGIFHILKHKVDVLVESLFQKGTQRRNSKHIVLKYILKVYVTRVVSMFTNRRNQLNSSPSKQLTKGQRHTQACYNFLIEKIKYAGNVWKTKRTRNCYYRFSFINNNNKSYSHSQKIPAADTNQTKKGYIIRLERLDSISKGYAGLYRSQKHTFGHPLNSIRVISSSQNVYRKMSTESRHIQLESLSKHSHIDTKLSRASQDKQANNVDLQTRCAAFIFKNVNKSHHGSIPGIHIYKKNRFHYSPIRQSFLRNRLRDGKDKLIQHGHTVNIGQHYFVPGDGIVDFQDDNSAHKVSTRSLNSNGTNTETLRRMKMKMLAYGSHVRYSESRYYEEINSKNKHFSYGKKHKEILRKNYSLKLSRRHLFKTANDNKYETNLLINHELRAIMNTLLAQEAKYMMANTSNRSNKYVNFKKQFTKRYKRQINLDSDSLIKADVLKDLYLRWLEMKAEINELENNIYKAKERFMKLETDLLRLIRRGYTLAAARMKVDNYNKLKMSVAQTNSKLIQKQFQKLKNEIHQLQSRRDIAEKNVFATKSQKKLTIRDDSVEEDQPEDDNTVNRLFHVDTLKKTKTQLMRAKGNENRLLDDHHSLIKIVNDDISKQLNVLSGLSVEDPDLVHVDNIIRAFISRSKRNTPADRLNERHESTSTAVHDTEKGANERNNVIILPKPESIIRPHRDRSSKKSFLLEDKDYSHIGSQIYTPGTAESRQTLMFLESNQLFGKQYMQDFKSIWLNLKEDANNFLSVIKEITLRYSYILAGIHELQRNGKTIDIAFSFLVNNSISTGNTVNDDELAKIKNSLKEVHAGINRYKKEYDRNNRNEIVQNVNDNMELFKKALDDEESRLQGQLDSASDPHTLLPFNTITISSWNKKGVAPDSGQRFINNHESNRNNHDTKHNEDSNSEITSNSLNDFNKYVKEVSNISDLEHVERILNTLIAEQASKNVNHVSRRGVSRSKRALRSKRRGGRGRGGRRHNRRYYSSTNMSNKRGKQMSGRKVAKTLHDENGDDDNLELFSAASRTPNDEVVDQAEKALNADLSYREIFGDKDLLVIRNKDFDTDGKKNNNPFFVENLSTPFSGKKFKYVIAKLPSKDKSYSSNVEPYLWKLTSSRDDKEYDQDELDNARNVGTYIHSLPTEEHFMDEITAAKQMHKDEITSANDINEELQEIDTTNLGSMKDVNKEFMEIQNEGGYQTQDGNVNEISDVNTGSDQYFINKLKSLLRRIRTPRKTILGAPSLKDINRKINTDEDTLNDNKRNMRRINGKAMLENVRHQQKKGEKVETLKQINEVRNVE